MKKKILAMLLALVMIISLLPVSVFAAEAEGEHDHAHCPGAKELHTLANCKWVKGETTAPICGQWGFTLYECEECGADFAADFVKPVGECDYEKVDGEAATCDEPGKKPLWTCKICGNVHPENNGEEIPALDHDFSGAKDCTEKAVCSRCGEEGEAGEHTYGKNPVLVKKPTADEIGSVKYICTTCGDEHFVDLICECTLPYLAHNAQFTIIAGEEATCTTNGKIASKICKCCGRMYATESYGEDIEAGDEIESNVIEKHHTWDNGTVTKQPSCLEEGGEGEIVYKCTKCTEGQRTETLEKLDHEFEETPNQVIKPTCTTYGFEIYCCTVCGWLKSTTAIDPLGHSVPFCWLHETADEECGFCKRISDAYVDGTYSYTARTCKNKGVLSYKCLDCNQSARFEMEPLGCEEVTVTVAATCNQYGYTFKYCARESCNNKIAKGNYTNQNKPQPEDATTAAEKIKFTYGKLVNGKVSVSEKVNLLEIVVDWEGGFDPDNHTRDNAKSKVINAPTCEEPGNEWFYCLYCNFYDLIVLDALEHDFAYDLEDNNTYTVKTPLSCTTDYVITVTCGNEGCDESKDFTIEETEGHVWDEGVEVPATCYAEAHILYTCTNECGETRPEVQEGTKVVYDPSIYYDSFEEAEAIHKITGKWNHTRKGSCTVVGLYQALCVECGKMIAVKEDKTGGHYTNDELADITVEQFETQKGDKQYEFAAKDPACGEKGWSEQFVCDGCDTLVAAVEEKALEHDWDKVDGEEATCKKEGKKPLWTCKVCEGVHSENDGSEIDKLTHEYMAVYNSADCTNFAHFHLTCKKGCGDEFVTLYRPEKGHTEADGEKAKVAKCEEDGWLHKVCSVCGITLKDEVITAKGHVNKDGDFFWGICTDTETDRECKDCGLVGKSHTDAYYDGVEYPPTCVDYGYIIHSCERCGLKEVEDINDGKLGAHNTNYSAEFRAFLAEKQVQHATSALLKEFFDSIGATMPTLHSKGTVICKTEGCGRCVPIEKLNGLATIIEVNNAKNAEAEIVDSSKVVITIKLDGNDVDLWGVRFNLKYETSVLSFDKAEFVSDTFLNGLANAATNGDGTEKGYVIVTANVANDEDKQAQNTNLNAEEVLVKLYFDVVVGQQTDNVESYVSIEEFEAAKATEDGVEDISALFTEDALEKAFVGYNYAEFEVAPFMDLNDDGSINVADALLFYNIISAVETPYDARADIDKDGDVDATDFNAFYQYLCDALNYADMANGGVKVEE